MRAWQLAVFCLALSATAGCRTPPAAALLEQENRELESQIYELADLVQDSRRENQKLQKRLKRFEDDSAGPARSDLPPELTGPSLGRADAPNEFVPLKSLEIEVPSEGISPEEFLKRFGDRETRESQDAPPPSPTQEAPIWVPPPEGEGTDADPGRGAMLGEPVHPRADNAEVAVITLNNRLTRGYNQDKRRGHDGITAVIEPRGHDGRLVDATAPVSVVVLDPALSGDAARLARWDFAAEEIAERFRKTPVSEGIHLEMTWPAALPVHDRLHVFVRYTTDDGRALQADQNIQIEPPALEARRPEPEPGANPPQGTSQAANGWQHSAAPPVAAPAREPARTALLPRGPESRSAQTPSPPPPREVPNGRPTWSPNRP